MANKTFKGFIVPINDEYVSKCDKSIDAINDYCNVTSEQPKGCGMLVSCVNCIFNKITPAFIEWHQQRQQGNFLELEEDGTENKRAN